MAPLSGFWSYVHADDDAERGRITQLARDVVSQFQLLTGDEIRLFLDRDDIQWGDEWRTAIDASLASVAFFVPVLTPRYFLSAECRRELQSFVRKAADLGVQQLVMPLLYVNVPGISGGTTEDDLVDIVTRFQWEDWRDLRFADVGAESYRRAVARLAAKLVDANMQAEHVEPLAIAAAEVAEAPDEEQPGFLDRIARLEEVAPEWGQTMEAIAETVNTIGNVLSVATEEIKRSDAAGKGFGGRMFIARKTARELAEPAEQIVSLANDFATQLHEVDEGIRALVNRIAVGLEEDPSSKEAVCEFFRVVDKVSDTAHHALGQTRQMIDAMEPLGKASRDLRPPLRRLKEGLTLLYEARNVMAEWVHAIDATGIDCMDGGHATAVARADQQ